MTQNIIKKNQKGFTLIELMIVIAIIGILAAIAIPNFISYRDKAYCSAAEADANSIAAEVANYFSLATNMTCTTDTVTTKFTNLVLSGGTANANTGTVTGAGTEASPTTITVTDTSARCPSGNTYILQMGGAVGAWTTAE